MTLTNTIAKVAAVAVAASLVVGVAFVAVAPRAEAASLTAAQVSSIVSLLQSFGADATTVANVTASLNGTAPSMPSTPSTPSACGFTRDLTLGAKGADVTCLQTTLIAKGYTVPAGATGFFGAQTQAAVIMWQKAAGVTPAAGYFGAKSRAAFGGVMTGPTTPVPTGTGLSVMAGASIPNSIAPQGASRVPFTNFTLTAGNDGDVVVNGITVQRTGLGSDASFDGVILVNTATGAQIGNSQNFNSNHQTAVGGTFTIPRGTTMTFQLAANMAANLAARAGEVPAISVVGVNTSASVTGALPITGAYHTINATLAVGTVTIATSNAFASNSNQTVNIGDTARKTTGLRLTAGSAEDITLKMVRFNQTGSVSSTDLTNVAVMINGTSYPLTVSADGKYYMASLGAGVLLAKGNQVDMYVSYDVIGGNANGRTVIFDVDKNTDILAYGNTYGYGISPSVPGGSVAPAGTRSVAAITTGSPFVYATQDTITGASVTTISKANEVPAQNIAINVPNQPLGGFVIDLKGESITTQSIVFTIASTTGTSFVGSSNLLTNVTLVNANGSVVAGPYDAVCADAVCTSQTVTMSSSITFPAGRGVFTIRGKVASGVTNGTIYTVSTTPTGWTNPRGNTSGNTIALTQTIFSMNPMTVKAGTLTIGAASSLTSQNIVPGGQQVEFARFAFDAGQSGEDARISSVPVDFAFTGGSPAAAATDLSSCQIYNGATSLTTGSNTVSPTGTTPVDRTFVLDNPVTVTKGSVVTLSLKCNVSGNAGNGATYTILPGTTGSVIGGFTITGAVSGTTLTKVAGSATGATFTVGAGTFTATAANASIAQPSLAPAAAGSTGVTLGYIKFRATNEPVNLTKVGLTLANGVYGTLARGDGGTSNGGQGDVLTVYLFNGATQVGTATFNGSQIATSTLNSAMLLPKDTDTILTIKADLAQIGVSGSGGIGNTVKIDPLNAEGTGASSGTVVAIGATAGVNGIKLVKSYPTVAFVSNSTNPNGTNVVLKKFTVTANAAGPVGIRKMVVIVATSSAMVTDGKLYVYTDSGYSQGLSSQTSGTGQIGTTQCAGGCAGNSPTWTFTASPNMVQITAGTTYYFALLGTVTPNLTANNWTISPTVQGDAAGQTGLGSGVTNGYIATTTANVATSNFTWSDNATTTAAITDVDWFNGFQVPGLPGTGF